MSQKKAGAGVWEIPFRVEDHTHMVKYKYNQYLPWDDILKITTDVDVLIGEHTYLQSELVKANEVFKSVNKTVNKIQDMRAKVHSHVTNFLEPHGVKELGSLGDLKVISDEDIVKELEKFLAIAHISGVTSINA